ncbi:MAG: prepilin-type N-terminal cleavage/methylation domain-containing protein [Polyangiaceae bacterium]|nr:prepilin-type N-terminal cleavage/methylation domain-containing protein [Polyangiaceae bacterium]
MSGPHLRSATSRAAARGLTLVEVLVVAALIAVMSAGVITGSGALSSSRERAAATLILSGVRLGVTRANATGKPVRMVFDLEEGRVSLEESAGRVMLREREEANTGGGAEAMTEAEVQARAEADRILKGPRAPRAKFSPVAQFGFDGEAGAGRELGSGIEFLQVQTEHDEVPRKEGRAYLYFFPGGRTERAAIQVRRKGERDGLTILVSPLTGRAVIRKGAIDLEAPRMDEEFGVRDDE